MSDGNDDDNKQEQPKPRLGRRVVDMRAHQPKVRKRKGNSGPESILQPRRSEQPTSPERPSVRDVDPRDVTVRVEDGSLEDFEALLSQTGVAPNIPRHSVGDNVEGLITAVGERWAYVDLGQGVEAVARVSDFFDAEGACTLQEGERRRWVVHAVKEGTITVGAELSTRENAMEAIDTALETGAPLTGRVTGKNKGGFEVDIGGVRAFCPISQIELGFTEEPDVHLHQSYQFRVTEVRDGGRSVVVSRAELLREEQARAQEMALEQIHEGMKIDGTVTRLADFGAFVDIGGGVEGLVHVSQLGFNRVEHPSEVVRKGDSVKVKVLKIEDSDKGPRIGLSMKDTMEDPWEAAMRDLYAGAKVTGTVQRIEQFGAFVEVAPNVEGLVHISEISDEHVKRVADYLSVGQKVDLEVLDVDLARRRISLSIKARTASGDTEARSYKAPSAKGSQLGTFADLLKDKLE